MPDTPMDKESELNTDAWNFVNCDHVLSTYPPKYIDPQRVYNKESWGNIKLTIENPNSVAHRCHIRNHLRPLGKADEGKPSVLWTERLSVWIKGVGTWRDRRNYNQFDNLQCNQKNE
tara:strand:- start:961 stop:1311 length:351 start_codon:yes stop_codon:yes gene_type:complete